MQSYGSFTVESIQIVLWCLIGMGVEQGEKWKMGKWDSDNNVFCKSFW